MRFLVAFLASLTLGCLVPAPDWSGQSGGASDAGGDPYGTFGDSARPRAPALIPTGCDGLLSLPDGTIVVGPADNDQLSQLVANAPAGSTLALQPGLYDRAGQAPIVFAAPGVTLRSTTGEPADVVLDAGGTAEPFLLAIDTDDIVIAEITLRNVAGSMIEIRPQLGALSRPSLYRLVLEDSNDAKIHGHQADDGSAWSTDGVVACSTFSMTTAFRDQQDDCARMAAIRVGGGRNWVFRDNLVRDQWCTSISYAAVTFDNGSRDTLVLRNRLLDNFRGILLGGDPIATAQPAQDTECGASPAAGWGHIGGLVQNNVIWVGATDPNAGDGRPGDAMIGFWRACGAAALHNTIVSEAALNAAIEWRFAETSVTIANNLTTARLLERDDGFAYGLLSNVSDATFGEFTDIAARDLHLVPTSTAIDAGRIVAGLVTTRDYDGNPRVGAPDLGAYESAP